MNSIDLRNPEQYEELESEFWESLRQTLIILTADPNLADEYKNRLDEVHPAQRLFALHNDPLELAIDLSGKVPTKSMIRAYDRLVAKRIDHKEIGSPGVKFRVAFVGKSPLDNPHFHEIPIAFHHVQNVIFPFDEWIEGTAERATIVKELVQIIRADAPRTSGIFRLSIAGLMPIISEYPIELGWTIPRGATQHEWLQILSRIYAAAERVGSEREVLKTILSLKEVFIRERF
jgi:hypothetical protein